MSAYIKIILQPVSRKHTEIAAFKSESYITVSKAQTAVLHALTIIGFWQCRRDAYIWN